MINKQFWDDLGELTAFTLEINMFQQNLKNFGFWNAMLDPPFKKLWEI